jgi:hypothetical protein
VNDPPQIIFRNVPSMLVIIDGEPALRAKDVPSLWRVISTNALILQDPTKHACLGQTGAGSRRN